MEENLSKKINKTVMEYYKSIIYGNDKIYPSDVKKKKYSRVYTFFIIEISNLVLMFD